MCVLTQQTLSVCWIANQSLPVLLMMIVRSYFLPLFFLSFSLCILYSQTLMPLYIVTSLKGSFVFKVIFLLNFNHYCFYSLSLSFIFCYSIIATPIGLLLFCFVYYYLRDCILTLPTFVTLTLHIFDDDVIVILDCEFLFIL